MVGFPLHRTSAESFVTRGESALAELVSGKRTYGTAATLEKITLNHSLSHYSFRSGGSLGANSAADWILNQFQECGLVAYREAFNFTTWDISIQPRLVVDIDDNSATKTDQIEIPSFIASHYSWSTSEGGIFRSLLALSPSNWNIDTTRKIILVGMDVLSEGNWRSKFENKLLTQTPAAIVFTWWYEGSLGMPFVSSSEGRSYWNLRIPIGWVSYEDGLKIRKLAQHGVAANLTIAADIGFGPHYNIVGRLDGLDPSKIVVFSAHYDTVMCPGFADNGAGTAGLIELARVFSYAKNKNLYLPPCTILFIAFASEEIGLLGSIEYVYRHKAEMDRIIAVINLDCIGVGDLRVTETWSDLDEIALSIAEELRVPAAQVFEHSTSDHLSFANPGIAEGMLRNLWPDHIIHIADAKARAAVTLASHPLFWIHTAYDSSSTPNWVKADNLEDHVKVAVITGLRVVETLPPLVKQSSIGNLLEIARRRKQAYDSLADALDPASALRENFHLWGETQIDLWDFTSRELHGMAQGSVTEAQRSALVDLLSIVDNVTTLGELFNKMTQAVDTLDQQGTLFHLQLFLQKPQVSKLRSDALRMSSLIAEEIEAIERKDELALRSIYQQESNLVSAIRSDTWDVKHVVDQLNGSWTESVSEVSETRSVPPLKKNQTWETEILLERDPTFMLKVESKKLNLFFVFGGAIKIEILDKFGRIVVTIDGQPDNSLDVPADILHRMKSEQIFWQDGKVYFKIRVTVLQQPRFLFLFEVNLEIELNILMRPSRHISHPTDYDTQIYDIVRDALQICESLAIEEDSYIRFANSLLA